eukprot:6196345-Pleurochrysis_carterae.AAC.3
MHALFVNRLLRRTPRCAHASLSMRTSRASRGRICSGVSARLAAACATRRRSGVRLLLPLRTKPSARAPAPRPVRSCAHAAVDLGNSRARCDLSRSCATDSRQRSARCASFAMPNCSRTAAASISAFGPCSSE